MADSARYHQLRDLEELLRLSVIQIGRLGATSKTDRVHNSNSWNTPDLKDLSMLGTGFFIDDRVAITCAHLFTGPDRYGKWADPPERAFLVWENMVGVAKVDCQRTRENQHRPDIAFLDEIEWGSGEVIVPSVMLSDDWDIDSEYYAFGHPGNRFENGDSLIFRYSGTDSRHTYGTNYKKMHGPFRAAGGFSGSPILNRARGKVCGLLAMSLNEDTAEGIEAVPISYAIEHRPKLAQLQHQLHRRTMWWPNLTPGGILWRNATKTCDSLTSKFVGAAVGAAEKYYQSRAIEDDICRFLKSDSTGMFIVGKSGMGKTTLLAKLAQEQQGQHNLLAMINSVDLTIELNEFEKDIVGKLGLVDPAKYIQARFWKVLDDEARWRDQQVILCIDAVNEYNPGQLSPRPVMLLDRLDNLAVKLADSASHIKLLVTCRPETWDQALNTLSKRVRNWDVYYRPHSDSESAWTLFRFSEDEFRGAYAKYSEAGKLKTTFEDLSDLAKYHLRDPFLLQLAESAFRGREVPREFDTTDLFDDYIDDLESKNLLDLVYELVDAMFLADGTRENISAGEEIKRAAVLRDDTLFTSRPLLHEHLDFENRLSKGFKLREKNVIREWEVRNGDRVERRIRFTYDRFAEYMLSRQLKLAILRRSEKGESLSLAAKSVIGANLGASQRMAIVYGAIQRTLILLKTEKEYATVLRTIAQIDARGQWLVISVLARTAKSVSGGIELLTGLLDELGEKEQGNERTFSVIDAVYRVLRDEDYRLWLKEQDNSLQLRHLNVLHGYFLAGLKSDDPVVFSAAIQYLFFLWKARAEHGFEDGLTITQRLVDEVKPLARMAISKSSRTLLNGLAAVFLLILPDAKDELEPRFSEALALASETIRRLKLPGLGKMGAVLMNTMLIDFFLKSLDKLPNPIQLASLKHYYDNKRAYLPDAEEVISLLRSEPGDAELTVETFKRLTCNDNSFIVQMLTFVLSTRYERSKSDTERASVLETIEQCFFTEPRTEISEYCSSLSVYHINCFGNHPTKASMDLMGRMATVILSERKGRLSISGKRHNFNIIGTYGRALHQNENIVFTQGAMQYALDGLQQARKLGDSEYYLYICDNLGLLGVLVEPKYLFDVFTVILKDVRVLPGSHKELPFSSREARDKIMQSLANIRVLYREQVDKYLLEVLESPELYAEIANERTPDFELSFFFSWSFEQLMFRCFVSHYEQMGSQVLDAFLDAVRCDSAPAGSRIVLGRLFNHVAGLAR